jgi:hypothetical protein
VIQCLANVSGLSAFMLDLPKQLNAYNSVFFDSAEPLLLPDYIDLIEEMIGCSFILFYFI